MLKKSNNDAATSNNPTDRHMPVLAEGLIELISPPDNPNLETPDLMTVKALVDKNDFLHEKFKGNKNIFILEKKLIRFHFLGAARNLEAY